MTSLPICFPRWPPTGWWNGPTKITVQQLVQHTSGIPDWFHESGSTAPAFDVFDFTTYYRPLDLVKMTRGRPRTGEPGVTYSCSNTDYTLIGMIVEKVTGHGYYPDSTGTLRDVHRLNASRGNGAGGVISTTRDVSALRRALDQGKLLSPALREVLTDGSAQQSKGLCGGKLQGQMLGGSAPGFTTLTFASTDGRQQFAVSVTRSTADDDAIVPVLIKTVEAVYCPAA